MSDSTRKRMISTNTKECRACLGKIYGGENSSDIFHAWDPPWTGMGISIAEDLTKITNVQITPFDSHSKRICTQCTERLQDAISFVSMVQNTHLILSTQQIEGESPSWPQPIQVDNGLASSTLNLSVHVKQEILSDNECEMVETYNEQCEPSLDIKIEPEEMTPAIHSLPQPNLPPVVEVNRPVSMSNTAEMTLRLNDMEPIEDEEITIQDVKDEPMSGEDSDSAVSDVDGMPNDCMLCMKSFNTVKRLKAHVIAAHSYDTIISPQVYREHVCKTCHRSFGTRTDLFVHETCHSKFACYVCDEKFDSFPLLTKHRSKQCMKTAVNPRVKTLEDVRRPLYIIADKNASQSKNNTLKTEDAKQTTDTKHLLKTQIKLTCKSNEDDKVEKKIDKPLDVKQINMKNGEIENKTIECLPQPDLPAEKTCHTTNNTCLLLKEKDFDTNQISEENILPLHYHESTEKLQDFSDDETKTSADLSLEEQIRSIVGESDIEDSNHSKKVEDSEEKPSDKSHDNKVTKPSIIESILDNKLQESNFTKLEENKIDCKTNKNNTSTVGDTTNKITLSKKPDENIQHESSSNNVIKIENTDVSDGQNILSEEKTQSQQVSNKIESQNDQTTETYNKLSKYATVNGQLIPPKEKLVDFDLPRIDSSENIQLEIHYMDDNVAMDVDIDQELKINNDKSSID